MKEALRSFRLRMGWTQRRMADELGITCTHVSFMETGQRPVSKPIGILLNLLIEKHEANAKVEA